MLPFIPLVLTYAPQLLKAIFGDRGAAVSKDVAGVIQTVTGIDPTTQAGVAAAQAALTGNSALENQLSQKLAEIAAAREAEANREADATRQAELEDLKLRVADIGDARRQTTTLAAEHNPLALGAPVLSGIILVSFAGMLLVLLVVPKSLDTNVLSLANIMLGTLAAMATQVANYWLGSSAGSAAKNSMLANAQNALWLSSPPASGGLRSAAPGPLPKSERSAAAPGEKITPASADDLNNRSLAAARAGH